jgi:glycosyltransferase involved in cell wall biosynthesis
MNRELWMNMNAQKLKLSVITTCKNESANITKTIDSVVAQTYDCYEYIVVDGGSVDGTVNIIKSYKNKITQFISEQDRGIWHAMNKGISLASGEYVYFLNAGDRLFDKETFSNIFSGNERTEDIIYGNIIDDYGSRQVQKSYPDTISIRFLLSNMICHQATFIRKELFHKYMSFDERYKFVADYDFLWRCIVKHKVSYKHLAQTIAYYDMNGLTSNPDNRDMLVREWLTVHNNNLSSFQYAYFRLFRPFFVKVRNLMFKSGAD